MGKRKQPANDFVMSHAFFDPVKKAKVKAVHKVRNKDLGGGHWGYPIP